MDPAQLPIDVTNLKNQIASSSLPADLKERLTNNLDRIERVIVASGFRIELDREIEYIKFMLSLPFTRSSEDILDIKRVAAILDKNHYGLHQVKERILEYMSVLILNKRQNHQTQGNVLAFVGLVGSGKTSLAYSIAEAMGRKIIRIPFGGLGSVAQLRGQSRVSLEAEPGSLMKAIATLGVNNPVVLLDEIDRVAQETRADVMGVLVELLDPEQNSTFVDYYVDHQFDLSKALFIATANNTGNIATAVMDRLEIVEMPSYSDEEKVAIAKNYILPKALQVAGLDRSTLTVDDTLWPQIVRPLGFDAGIRSLQRTIQSMVRKVARAVVEGRPGPYHLDAQSIGGYIQ